tara:strand:- start:269 stop:919 length:651 start_codon:yes stop_codon:yes gene_type:complete
MGLGNVSSGIVRGSAALNYGDGEGYTSLNSRGDLLVAQSIPQTAEIVRMGDSWTCSIATGSAFTSVAGYPTTRSELSLYNGEPSTGKSYVIERVWWCSITSITAASGASIVYQVGASIAALTDDTAQLINSPLGKVYGGRAKRAVATTTHTANKWAVLESLGAGAAVSIGTGLTTHVNGAVIVPPGATIGLNVVLGTAVGTNIIGVSWHEVQLKIN